MPTDSVNLENSVRLIRSNLSLAACQEIFELAKEVPKDGSVFDLHPGEGLSTVVAALGIQSSDFTGTSVVSVDSHIVNPLSSRAIEEGSLMSYMAHLRQFGVMGKVCPVLFDVGSLSKVFPKKSASLVVVQVPDDNIDFNLALTSAIHQALHILRTKGKVIVFCNNEANFNVFAQVTSSLLGKGCIKLKETPFYRVYEAQGKA